MVRGPPEENTDAVMAAAALLTFEDGCIHAHRRCDSSFSSAECIPNRPNTNRPPKGIEVRYFNYFLDFREFEFWKGGNRRYCHLTILFVSVNKLNFQSF